MLKVMIVEDDSEIAALHAHFIAKEPSLKLVGIAVSFGMVREMMEIAKPDLVIVDNYLPDGRGVDLVYEWLKLEHKPECILITAANDAQTVNLAHRYGAFDYLVKPVDYQRLSLSLNKFIQVRQHLSQANKLHQSELDSLFYQAPTAPEVNNSTDEFTLKQVVAQFAHAHVEQTASSVAEMMNISKSTARRYLDKAVDRGELTAFLEHGKVGRPTRVYCRPIGIKK